MTIRLRTVRGRTSAGSYGATASYSLRTRLSRNSDWYAPRSSGRTVNSTSPAVSRSSRCAAPSAGMPSSRRSRARAVSVTWLPRGVVARKCGLSATTTCSSRYTTSIGNGTRSSSGSSRWNHTNIPGTYAMSGGTGRPVGSTISPASSIPSITPAPAASRATRCSRTVAHASPTGNRTRTGSTPSRCGRGEGGGGVRRLITIKRTSGRGPARFGSVWSGSTRPGIRHVCSGEESCGVRVLPWARVGTVGLLDLLRAGGAVRPG